MGIHPHISNFHIPGEGSELTNLESRGTFPFLAQSGTQLKGFSARELNYTATEIDVA